MPESGGGASAKKGRRLAKETLPSEESGGKERGYIVVARRYRPQRFEELIGQEHVAKALANAITTHRVGHAYLFTGARGVGKTSAARIFAKALNCQQGMSPEPCNQCDLCQAISTGDDVDVLEIDGASNRGIEEIRTLRQNVHVRPSRSRFKIYIIDEVHMLTKEAFNALLKTLEEPPQHVKFIFCTTEPNKIPITILSRCQRFDFAGIGAQAIHRRLQQIVEAEQVSVEPEVLEVLARRAAGSMRDAQSLLEQLLAFAPEKITLADVHQLLGTAGDERMARLVARLVARDAAGALAELDAAIQEGVDVALLMEQMLGYFRDCMVAALGCPAQTFVYTPARMAEEVIQTGQSLGLHTLLAVVQLLDYTLGRMKLSTQSRILVELALVRICHLEDLDQLSELIAALRSGGGEIRVEGSPARKSLVQEKQAGISPAQGETSVGEVLAKKKEEPPAPSSVEEKVDSSPRPKSLQAGGLSSDNAAEIWQAVLRRVGPIAGEHGRYFASIVVPSPNRLVIFFDPAYTVSKVFCERAEQLARFEKALEEVVGYPVQVSFHLAEPTGEKTTQSSEPPVLSYQERLGEVQRRVFVQRAIDLFGAQPVQLTLPEPPEKDSK